MSTRAKKSLHPLSYSHTVAHVDSRERDVRSLSSVSSAALGSPRSFSASPAVSEAEFDEDEADRQSMHTTAEQDDDSNEGKVISLNLSQYKVRYPSLGPDLELRAKDDEASLDASRSSTSAAEPTKKKMNRWKSIKLSLGKSLKRVRAKASPMMDPQLAPVSVETAAATATTFEGNGSSDRDAAPSEPAAVSRIVAKFMKRFADAIDGHCKLEPFVYYTYFRCRLDKTIPFRGTLSLCNAGIYFYGALFKHVTRVSIPHQDIIHMQKVDHLGGLGIKISTLSKQYTFTHFKDIECVYSLVAHLWQNHSRQSTFHRAPNEAEQTESGYLSHSQSLKLEPLSLPPICEDLSAEIVPMKDYLQDDRQDSAEQGPVVIWRRASLDSTSSHGLNLRRRRSSVESQLSIIRSSMEKEANNASAARQKRAGSARKTASPLRSLQHKSKPAAVLQPGPTVSQESSQSRGRQLFQKIAQAPFYAMSLFLFLLNYLTRSIFYSESSQLVLGFFYYACYPHFRNARLQVQRLKANLLKRDGKRRWLAAAAAWLATLALLLVAIKSTRAKDDMANLGTTKTWIQVRERAQLLEQIRAWEVANHWLFRQSLRELHDLL